MMRISQILIVSCLAFGNLAFGQVQDQTKPSSLVRAERPQDRLRLTTRLVQQKYCAGPTIRLTLNLEFTNVGNEPILLYRESSLIARYMISRSRKSAHAKKHEINVAPFYGLLGLGLHPEEPVDDSSFVTLKPGESHSLEKNLDLHIGKVGSRQHPSVGEHFLQIRVATWYYQPFLADELRHKWRQKGFLWSDAITSLPMPFAVEKRSLTPCP
jgi:hypothetical protein